MEESTLNWPKNTPICVANSNILYFFSHGRCTCANTRVHSGFILTRPIVDRLNKVRRLRWSRITASRSPVVFSSQIKPDGARMCKTRHRSVVCTVDWMKYRGGRSSRIDSISGGLREPTRWPGKESYLTKNYDCRLATVKSHKRAKCD